jgi:hypothetical protein
MVFTAAERALLNNVASWNEHFFRAGWWTLPGPSSLWPDDYDFEQHGFMPAQDPVAAKSAYMLFRKNMYKARAPEGFEAMSHSTTELRWKMAGEVTLADL